MRTPVSVRKAVVVGSVVCLAVVAWAPAAVGAAAVTRTFRAGDTNGSVVSDGGINGAAPTTSYGTAGYIGVNVTSGGHALLRFENLFGNGPHQIPYGSTITSARITLYLSGVPASGPNIAQLHRMLVPWQESATYNSMTTSGPGISHDNVEARATADALSNVSIGSSKSFAVTATVQDWANGATMYGWTLWRNNATNMNVTLSNNSVAPRRPLLTVTFTPPG